MTFREKFDLTRFKPAAEESELQPGEAGMLRWLAMAAEEAPPADEPTEEEFSMLLSELKAAGREMRKRIIRDVEDESTNVGSVSGKGFRGVEFSRTHSSEATWTNAFLGFVGHLAPPRRVDAYKDLAEAKERWFVPRGRPKWKWGSDRRRSVVDLMLREVDTELNVDALAVDKNARLIYAVEAKWRPNSRDANTAETLTLEWLRHRATNGLERVAIDALLPETWPPVVHGDLNPQNIMVACEGSGDESLLVLIDFSVTERLRDERWVVELQPGEKPPAADGECSVMEEWPGREGRTPRERPAGPAKRRRVALASQKARSRLRRPDRRGRRVPERLAPPAPAAVVVVDGSKVAEHLRPPAHDAAACLYLALPQRLTPAKDHLPQLRDFWHSTLQMYLDEGVIDRSAM
ncbi:hypothetical protein ACFYYS_18505 [Streptomyces sp. NPDC002120]|uniref:hypothetical protein n=1 Tax=Streptomyces sp. NPDC002120 TaxID=3364631 RepID=UPI0036A0E0A9